LTVSPVIYFVILMMNLTYQKIPTPAIERMCSVYNVLVELEKEGLRAISSGELGSLIGVQGTSIRKDLSIAGILGNAGARYNIIELKKQLENRMGIGLTRKACVIGIGKLGSAILDFGLFSEYGFEIVAGFDSNMNIVETKKTRVKLYPASEIADIIRREKIELAFLCVPARSVSVCVNRLEEGGIKGILNFSSAVVNTANKEISVKRIDIVRDMRVTSLMSAKTENNLQVS
jgi:redox-sensing transcriptional repressor